MTLTPEHLQRIRDAAQKKGSMLTDQEREIALYGSVEYERQQKEKEITPSPFAKRLPRCEFGEK